MKAAPAHAEARRGIKAVGIMRKACMIMSIILMLAGISFAGEMRIIVAVKGRNMNAVLEDNPASRALFAQLPAVFKMRNVFGREMSCTLPIVLPTGKLSANSYRVGDIIYMPHRHSLSIIYKQNGERFQRQHIGHIEAGAEIFAGKGNIDVLLVPAE